MFLVLYKLNKLDTTLLVSFRGAGGRFLLPLDRPRLCSCSELSSLAAGYSFILVQRVVISQQESEIRIYPRMSNFSFKHRYIPVLLFFCVSTLEVCVRVGVCVCAAVSVERA